VSLLITCSVCCFGYSVLQICRKPTSVVLMLLVLGGPMWRYAHWQRRSHPEGRYSSLSATKRSQR